MLAMIESATVVVTVLALGLAKIAIRSVTVTASARAMALAMTAPMLATVRGNLERRNILEWCSLRWHALLDFESERGKRIAFILITQSLFTVLTLTYQRQHTIPILTCVPRSSVSAFFCR